MAVCTMFNWGFNFIVSYWFLNLVKAIGQAETFWLYALFGVGAIVFFAWKVPETKNRSLEQIEREVRGEPQVTRSSCVSGVRARRERSGGDPSLAGRARAPLAH